MANFDKDKLVDQLFELITLNSDNEQEIITLLNGYKGDPMIQIVINKIFVNNRGSGETMLMWATWRFKKHVVKLLLELGANPKYVNYEDDSVSTYFDISNYDQLVISQEKQILALDIAMLLHNKGADLSKNSFNAKSLVLRSKTMGYPILHEGLLKMGYTLDE